MKGMVFTGERTLEMRDFDDPTPGPGDVMVEMKASGMCGSDLKPYRRRARAARPGARPGGRGRPGDRRATSRAAWSPRSAPASTARPGPHRPARDGPPLPGLRHLQPLPHRLGAAVPSKASTGLWHHRPWRPRAVHGGAGQHAGGAARRAVLLRGRRDLLRHRHGLGRAAAAERLAATTPSRSSARGRSGCRRRSSASAMGARVIALDISARAPGAAPRSSARRRWSTRGSNDAVAGDPRADPRRGRRVDARHLAPAPRRGVAAVRA